MEGMPDLEGQPAWVVIVVVGLLTMGTIGSAWLGRRTKRRDEKGGEDDAASAPHRGGVPSLPSGTAGVLEASVNAIIRDADAGRVEVAETRAEMRKLQHRYNEVVAERDEALRRARVALHDLGVCTQQMSDLRKQMGAGA